MNIFPNMRTNYPGIAIKEIEDAEIELGYKLPGEVREFYITHNGGRILGNHSIKIYEDYKDYKESGYSEDIVNCIYSIGDNGEINALNTYKKLISMDRIPVKSFPFANDPGGNLFLIIIEEDNFGKVYFWNHELEDGDIDDGPYLLKDFHNVCFVADGIMQFFDMMYP